MDYSEIIVYILEIIGTIAFASSGALVGIRKKMDIFGVNVLGVTTAVGGGLIRDVVLDITPPNMFQHPSYTLMAIATSCLLFVFIYYNRAFLNSNHMERYEQAMNLADSLGLAAFTVIGINTAIQASYGDRYFLMIFVGMITGVGGGMMRDVMAGRLPYVFVKHVYACASMAGAIVCVLLREVISDTNALILGAVVIMVIRILATYYKWNLPKIDVE